MRRFPAAIIAAAAGLYVLEARTFETHFIADPVGPRAFPYVIGLLALLASAFMLARPDEVRESLPDASFGLRAAILVAGLWSYAWWLEDIGFVLATTLLMTLLVAIFRGRIVLGFVGAVFVSAGVYALFVYAFSVPLPFGRLFGGT